MDIDNASQLWTQVRRFVRHRERMMLYHGAIITTYRLKAISQLYRVLDHFKRDKPLNKAKVIANHMHLLQTIAAGANSKYHKSDQEKLDAFVRFCNAMLKQDRHPKKQAPCRS